jgi:hypothetical protein
VTSHDSIVHKLANPAGTIGGLGLAVSAETIADAFPH